MSFIGMQESTQWNAGKLTPMSRTEAGGGGGRSFISDRSPSANDDSFLILRSSGNNL